MAFARGEDSRLASSYDTCCLGLYLPGSGRRVFPCGRGDPCRRAGALACTAFHCDCTRGARESAALMPAVQSLCTGQPRKTRREV